MYKKFLFLISLLLASLGLGKETKAIMVVSETNVNSISEKTPLYLEHSSIIFQNQNNNVIAWHTSHYSHSSHYSHESHYSHYSHYSGR